MQLLVAVHHDRGVSGDAQPSFGCQPGVMQQIFELIHGFIGETATIR